MQLQAWHWPLHLLRFQSHRLGFPIVINNVKICKSMGSDACVPELHAGQSESHPLIVMTARVVGDRSNQTRSNRTRSNHSYCCQLNKAMQKANFQSKQCFNFSETIVTSQLQSTFCCLVHPLLRLLKRNARLLEWPSRWWRDVVAKVGDHYNRGTQDQSSGFAQNLSEVWYFFCISSTMRRWLEVLASCSNVAKREVRLFITCRPFLLFRSQSTRGFC